MDHVSGSLPNADSPEEGIAGSVSGEWVEVEQPDGEPERPAPKSARGYDWTPTTLFGLSLTLVVFANVLPLFVATTPGNPGPGTIEVTAWQVVSTAYDSARSLNFVVPTRNLLIQSAASPIPLGYPLALAGLLLVAVLVLRLRAGRGARVTGITAAAFLAGLTFGLAMFELAWQRLLLGPLTTEFGVGGRIGQGFWLLVLAAVLALVAAALTLRSRPARAEPVRNDWPDEPAQAPAEKPSGQPAEWPVVAVIPVDERTNW